MNRKLPVELAVILKSAAIMFLVPLPLVLAVLLVVGVTQFFATGDVSIAFERVAAFRLSPINVWLSYAAYGLTTIVVGYRLAVQMRIAAILHIWLSIALVGCVHLVLHGSSHVAYIGAFDNYKHLQFPVVLIVTAFTGFHVGCLHRSRAFIER